jgi:hypothetical protein
MKKLLFLCLGLMPLFAVASHEYGAQVSSRYIANGQQEIRIKVWVDSGGVISNTAAYQLQGGGATNNYTASLSSNTALGNAIQELLYLDTVGLNAAVVYKAIYETCCRKQSISNVTMPASQSMHVYTEIHNTAPALINSTPEFVNSPVFFSSPNDTLQHNPTGVDIDGDSLVYTYLTPMGAGGAALPMTFIPYPGSAFTVDAITGEIYWIPSSVGDYVYAVRVDEYRNGTLIGRSVRDAMVTICVGCKTTMSTSFQFYNTAAWPQSAGYTVFTAYAGVPFNYTFQGGLSGMTSNTLSMGMIGEANFHPNAPAMNSVQTGSDVSGSYSWTPTAAQVRNRPYLNVLFGKETNTLMQNRKKERTIQVKVLAGNPTAVSQVVENQQVVILPNPASDLLSMQIDNRNASWNGVRVVNATGQLIWQQDFNQAGMEAIQCSTASWSDGVYLLHLTGKNARTERILIRH